MRRADGESCPPCGSFASGHYHRGATRIGLPCREAIDNLDYWHTFETTFPCMTSSETFTIRHSALMSALGYAEVCQLVDGDRIPDAIVARDGGDRVSALLFDLEFLAAPVLRSPCEEFDSIIRRGARSYSVT